MTNELEIVSLESYRTERATYRTDLLSLLACATDASVGKAFAHVLNVPISEEIWPGDAAEVFFPQLFAFRLSGDELYVLDNYVHEHMRCEILRLCFGEQSALERMEDEIRFYCRVEGSFPKTLSDGCEDEPDTLNSELLVFQEYVPPQDI